MEDIVELDNTRYTRDIEQGELLDWNGLLADRDSGCIGQIITVPRVDGSGKEAGNENVVFKKIIEDESGVRGLEQVYTQIRFFTHEPGSRLTAREMKSVVSTQRSNLRIVVDATAGGRRALVFTKK